MGASPGRFHSRLAAGARGALAAAVWLAGLAGLAGSGPAAAQGEPAGSAPGQQTLTISATRKATNGGFMIDGGDTFTITGTGSITTRSDDSHALRVTGTGNTVTVAGAAVANGTGVDGIRNEAASDNAYRIRGSVRAEGGGTGAGFRNAGGHRNRVVITPAGAVGGSHGIHNESGDDNEYLIDGRVTASGADGVGAEGADGYAIYNAAGSGNRYVLRGAAIIDGPLRADSPAILDLGQARGDYSLELHGEWQDAQGDALRHGSGRNHVSAIGIVRVVTNGGFPLDGGDVLRIGSGGGIHTMRGPALALRGAGNWLILAEAAAVSSGGGFGVGTAIMVAGTEAVITIHGLVTAGDDGDHALHLDGGGNMVSIGATGTVTTAGAKAHGLFNATGDGNGYRIDGVLAVSGAGAHAIYHAAGDNADYAIGGIVAAAGADSHAIYHQGGAGATYTLRADAALAGSLRADVPATLIMEPGFDPVGISAILGEWVDADGEAIAIDLPPVITTTEDRGNGGWLVDGGDRLTVAATGAIATAAAGEAALSFTGSGNRVTAAGRLATTGNSAPAIVTGDSTDSRILAAGAVTTTGIRSHGLFSPPEAMANRYLILGDITATGDSSHGIVQDGGGGHHYLMAGDITVTGGSAGREGEPRGVWLRRGSDSVVVVTGDVVTGGAAALSFAGSASNNQMIFRGNASHTSGAYLPVRIGGTGNTLILAAGSTVDVTRGTQGNSVPIISEDCNGSGNRIIIGGTVRGYATGQVPYAVNETCAIGNTYVIAETARITGRLGASSRGGDHTRLDIRLAGSYTLAVQGNWSDAAGDPLRLSSGVGHVQAIAEQRAGSFRLPGAGRLTITETGGITVTAADATALVSAGAANWVTIAGRVAATGAGGSAIRNQSAGSRFVIEDGAEVIGALNTTARATLDIRATGSYRFAVSGQWQDAAGNDLRGGTGAGFLATIADTRFTTNGGESLDGGDALAVVAAGRVAVFGSDTAALSLTGSGNALRVAAGGTVGAIGSANHGIEVAGGEHRLTVAGSVTTTGVGGVGLEMKANQNVIVISGQVTTTARAAPVLRNASGSGNSYLISGSLEARNDQTLAVIEHVAGDDATYTISGTLRASGASGARALAIKAGSGNIVVIEEGAEIEGSLWTAVPATLDIRLADWDLDLQGEWRDPSGKRVIADSGAEQEFTVSSSATETNDGWVLDGGDSITVAEGHAITVADDATHAIETAGDGNTVTVHGSLTASGSEAAAIYNRSGTDTEVLLGATAAIEGVLFTAEPATLDIRYPGDYSLTLEGEWLDTAGNPWRHTAERGSLSVVTGDQAATNGGQSLAGFDHLTVTARGAIATTAAGAHAIHATGSANRVVISGTLSAADANAHAVQVDDDTGQTQVVVTAGANVTGLLHAGSGGAMLDVRLADNNYILDLMGAWHDVNGNPLLEDDSAAGRLITIGTARADTNGGYSLANDHLRVAPGGSIVTAAAGVPAIHNSGAARRYTIEGRVGATAAGGYAIFNENGASTYTIGADAAVTGRVRTDTPATLIIMAEDWDLALEGDWRDAAGRRVSPSSRPAQSFVIDSLSDETNGGWQIDGDDTLTVTLDGRLETATGESAGHGIVLPAGADGNRIMVAGAIDTSAGGGTAILNAGGHDNMVELSGSITLTDNSLRAIHNMGDGSRNTYTVRGVINAAGASSPTGWAIDNASGADNAYVLAATAQVSGLISTAVPATLEISIGGSYALDVQGDWRDSAGEALRHTEERGWLAVLAAAATASNGGYTLDGNDSLAIAAAGSITETRDSAAAVDLSGDNNSLALAAGASLSATTGTGVAGLRNSGDGSVITLDGSVTSAGPMGTGLILMGASDNTVTVGANGRVATTAATAAHAIRNAADNGTLSENNRYVIGGTVTTAGTASVAILNESGGGNSYAIDNAVTTAGADSPAIRNKAGDGNSYMIAAGITVSTTGPAASVLHNEAGAGNSYGISGDLTAMGDRSHGIHNAAGSGNDYTVSGGITAGGSESLAIYNQAGDNTYRLEATARISGAIKTDVTARLIFAAGFDSAGLTIEGDWRDATGNPIGALNAPAAQRITLVGGSPRATSNGGRRLDGGDEFTVSHTASINTTAAGEHAIVATGSDNLLVPVGSVLAAGADAHGLAINGTGNIIRAGGVITASGANGLGIEMVGDNGELAANGDANVSGTAGALLVDGTGNTVALSPGGTFSAGAGGSVIFNRAGANTYTLGGTLSGATTAGSHAILNMAGASRYTLGNASRITGLLRTMTATATLDLSALAGSSYGLEVEGAWLGADGNPLRADPERGWLVVITDSRTATNGGYEGLASGANHQLTVTDAGSITDTGSDHAIHIGGDRSVVRVAGDVSTQGDEAFPLYHEAGSGNRYTVGDQSEMRAFGAAAHAIYHQAGSGNSYTVRDQASVAANGDAAHAIYHQAGSGNSYTVRDQGELIATGTGGHVIYHQAGSGNSYTIGGTLLATYRATYAIYHQAGADNRFTLEEGARVTGLVRTLVPAVLDIQMTGIFSLDLEGPWQDANGRPIRHTSQPGDFTVIDSWTDDINGGWGARPNGVFTVTADGAIDTAASPLKTGIALWVSQERDNVRVVMDGSLSTSGARAYGLLNHGHGNRFAIGGTIRTASQEADGIHNLGNDNRFTVRGSVASQDANGVAQAGAHGIHNSGGNNNTYVISGSISATGAGAHAIYNRAGTGNTYILEAGARIDGSIRTAVRATLIFRDGFDSSALSLDGNWRDAHGLRVAVGSPTARSGTIAAGSQATETNGGHVLDGGDTLVVAEGAGVTTTAGGVHAVWATGDGNTVTVYGALSATGATGEGASYAIYNESGASTFILDNADVTGVVRTDVPATLIVRETRVFRTIELEGDWRNESGESWRRSTARGPLIISNDSITPGGPGATLAGEGTFIGRIRTDRAEPGLFVTGNRNWVVLSEDDERQLTTGSSADSPLKVSGANGGLFEVRAGHSLVTQSASSRSPLIHHVSGNDNTYILSGHFVPSSLDNHPVYHQGGTGNTFILQDLPAFTAFQPLKTDVPAVLDIRSSDPVGYDLWLEGPWRDAAGRPLRLTDSQGHIFAIANERASGLGGHALDGGDTLIVTATGSLRNNGNWFGDGTHNKLLIEEGGTVTVTGSRNPLAGIGMSGMNKGDNEVVVAGRLTVEDPSAPMGLHSNSAALGTWTVTATGEVAVTGADARGIHNTGSSAANTANRFAVDGSVTVVGDNAIGILNELAGGNRYVVTGTLSATLGDGGTGKAYAIYNKSGADNHYTIGPDAKITGAVRTDVPATLDISGSYDLELVGDWRDPMGYRVSGDSRMAQVFEVTAMSAETNGGYRVDGEDSLRILATGGIATTAAGVHGVVAEGDGNRVTVAAGGSLSAAGAGAYAIYHKSGIDGEYVLEDGAMVDGILRTDVPATLDVQFTESYTLRLQGPWRDPAGRPWLPNSGSGHIVSIVDDRADTNGGLTLVNDRLVIQADGSIVTTEPAAHALHNTGVAGAYEVSGTLMASGEGADAIYNEMGDSFYAINDGADVVGAIRTDVPAVLDIRQTGPFNYSLDGEWRDADGNYWLRNPKAPGRVLAIEGRHLVTNGGETLGNDHLILVRGASIEVGGTGLHAIHNVGMGRHYTINGFVAHLGLSGHAIYNQEGDSVFRINLGARIFGEARTDVRATLILGEGIEANRLNLSGDWRDAEGFRVLSDIPAAQAIVISAAVTETNDGYRLDGADSLTVTPTGSITTSGATGVEWHGILGAGHGNTVTVSGPVTAAGAGAGGIYHQQGTGNRYTVTGTGAVTVTGAGSAAIHNAGGADNEYVIDGTVSAGEGASYAIYNETGANTYTLGLHAEVSGVVRTEVRATLALHRGFDYSNIVLEGEWVDDQGQPVVPVANRIPIATNLTLPPLPLAAERRMWSFAPGDLEPFFTDEDGDSLTFSFVDLPEWLTAHVDGDTGAISVSGTPPAGTAGTTFTLVIAADDGARGVATRRLTHSISPTSAINADPTVVNAIGDRTAVTGQRDVTVNLALTFADDDGDPLRITATEPDGSPLPRWLQLERDEAAGTYRLMAAVVGGVGLYSIRVTATDGYGTPVSDSFVFRVVAVEAEPAEPVAMNDRFALTVGQPMTGDVLENDFDPNGETLRVARYWLEGLATVTVPAGTPLAVAALGAITIGADGTFTLAPNDEVANLAAGAELMATVAYQADDGVSALTADETASSVAILTLVVTGSGNTAGPVAPVEPVEPVDPEPMPVVEPNHAPAVDYGTPGLIAYVGFPFSYTVPGNAFADGDGEPLSYAAAGVDGAALPGWLRFDVATARFSGIPQSGDETDVIVILRAEDAAGDSAITELAIAVESFQAIGTLTFGTDNTLRLELPYVELLPLAVGEPLSRCLQISMHAPRSDPAQWTLESLATPATGCVLPTGHHAIPKIDGALSLDVPVVEMPVGTADPLCMAMQFRYVEGFELVATAAAACPAP